jgi:hypothetical protein
MTEHPSAPAHLDSNDPNRVFARRLAADSIAVGDSTG